jgi:hypothetical protein
MLGIKMKYLFKKKILIWSLILSLALTLRLYGLDLNPVGITHDDELREIINAKSLAITGINLPGTIAGVLTQKGHCIVGDCVYGELESYFLIPWMKIFPLDLVLSKIPFVLGSVLLVFVTGKLFENLFKNTTVGIIVGLIVAINPWAIYFGRTAYPQLVSHLFYILGLYFFTRHKSYKSNLILGGLFSFFASLFYFGAKPILPLVILWGIAYNLSQFKTYTLKFIFLFVLVTFFAVSGYFFILSHSDAGIRLKEIETTNPNTRIERFLGFFSPMSLFLVGQKDSDNSYISNHGFYYLADLPFLAFGIIVISRSLPNTLFIFILLAISVMPAALKTSETSNYSLRAALAYPILSGIIGAGHIFFWSKISKKFFISKIFLTLVIIVYSLSLTYFLAIYWYRIPRIQATRWFFHERVLTNYITRLQNKNSKRILVLTARPDGIFNTFAFYSGVYNSKNTINMINSGYLSSNFEYRGVRFIDDCHQTKKEDLANSVILVDQINPVYCGLDQKDTPKIANPRDAGGIFNIVNEFLCSNYPKQRYPDPKSIYDFNIENLTDEAFCRIWITNPD